MHVVTHNIFFFNITLGCPCTIDSRVGGDVYFLSRVYSLLTHFFIYTFHLITGKLLNFHLLRINISSCLISNKYTNFWEGIMDWVYWKIKELTTSVHFLIDKSIFFLCLSFIYVDINFLNCLWGFYLVQIDFRLILLGFELIQSDDNRCTITDESATLRILRQLGTLNTYETEPFSEIPIERKIEEL